MDEGSKAHGQEYMVTLERFHSVFGAAKHIKVSDNIQILSIEALDMMKYQPEIITIDLILLLSFLIIFMPL